MKADWSGESWVPRSISAIIEESSAITYIIHGRGIKIEIKKWRRIANLSPNNKNIWSISNYQLFPLAFSIYSENSKDRSQGVGNFELHCRGEKCSIIRERHLLPAIFMECDSCCFSLSFRNNITHKTPFVEKYTVHVAFLPDGKSLFLRQK